ncbi:hypothetical protein Tco_0657184 [Tanacetum coccineum]|uniref:Reverse transcriptase domain-containing protein n=1 Tax=Tanacetum coccineum TaxID=301880 RepID=A0ABQ4XAW6_9ASTR
MREGSQNSSAGTLPARYRNPSERPKMRDHLRSNDGNVFGRLGIVLTVEVILTDGTLLLAEIILEAETAPAASKNRMVIPAPPTGHGSNIDITLVIGTAPRDGETIEDFMERFKVETRRMKGAPECMRIFGFMHGVNNPELTKRLNEHVPKTMEEMMTATTLPFHNEDRKLRPLPKMKGQQTQWKPHDQPKRHVSEWKSDFQAGKFKPPPPMVTPVEKRSSNKFCDFHNDKGHSTDECIQLKKQIEELVRAGKLSHLIKEIKQGRDQPKVGKKEVPAKDKSMAIYMGVKGPLVIEAEIGGHMIHRMYVDAGSSTEVLYEHCFNQRWLLVTIGDAEHSTKAWMNFMIVRSLSPYNGIIGRPGIREIQAVPSTALRMLKFPVDGGIITIHSTILIPTECATMTTSSKEILKEAEKKRGQATERAKAIQAKVQKLVEVGIMREVYYHDWLSNLVMVKKHDSSWRMCVDFTDLNKACYHQIHMAELDEEKTAFHTSHRVYCYTKMPFGLKNTDATYQRLFTLDTERGAKDMEMNTFRTLRKINMKLNPKRCTFEAVEGMFLGYKISPEGIKPCPNQTEVVLRLSSPRIIKEIQSLNGKLASLNIFLSKSVEKSLPLFKTLKKCIKKSYFHWTPEEE